MMQNKTIYRYRFADVVLEIQSPTELRILPKYEAFRADAEEPDYVIELIPLEPTSEIGRDVPPIVERKGKYITLTANGADYPNIAAGNVFSLAKAAFLFPENDAFILHASYIFHNGRAILFTAPSGVGKSTQAGYWHDQRGAEIINGDRVLITRRNGVFYANGIYVSGTSGICRNLTAPIGNVILLEQGSENELRLLPARELFLRLLCQCSFDIESTDQYSRITALVTDLINTTPVNCYRCRNHPDAVDDLERYLWNEKQG